MIDPSEPFGPIASLNDLNESIRLLKEEQRALAARANQVEALLAQRFALVHLVSERPALTEIFNPPVAFAVNEEDRLYTLCMQLGYKFAVFKGTVHVAGRPGEMMMDTGVTLSSLS